MLCETLKYDQMKLKKLFSSSRNEEDKDSLPHAGTICWDAKLEEFHVCSRKVLAKFSNELFLPLHISHMYPFILSATKSMVAS